MPETLDEMSKDRELEAILKRLKEEGQQVLTREEKQKRQRSLDNLGAPSFSRTLLVSRKKCLGSLKCQFCAAHNTYVKIMIDSFASN